MHLLEINKENYIGQADRSFLRQTENSISTPQEVTEFTHILPMTFSVNGIFTAEFLLMRARAFTIFGRRA